MSISFVLCVSVIVNDYRLSCVGGICVSVCGCWCWISSIVLKLIMSVFVLIWIVDCYVSSVVSSLNGSIIVKMVSV